MGDIGELRIEGQAGASPALLGADIASRHALREACTAAVGTSASLERGPSGYAQVFLAGRRSRRGLVILTRIAR